MQIIAAFLALLVGIFAFGARSEAVGLAGATPSCLSGTLLCHAPVVLPPQAVVRVSLVDLSRAEGAAPVAEQVIRNPGALPLPFNVEFNPAAILPQRRYGLQAQVTVNGLLQFATPAPVAVFTNSSPYTHELLLEAVGPPSAQPVEGEWRSGHGASHFQAFFSNGRLQYLKERPEGSDGGDCLREYCFDGSALLYFRERRSGATSDPRRPGPRLEMRLVFDASGGLIDYEKTESDRPVPLDEAEVVAVFARAGELLTAASRAVMPPSEPPSEPDRERLHFRPGRISTAVEGQVRGYAFRDYVVAVRARQTLSVRLRSANRLAHFMVQSGGRDLLDTPTEEWVGQAPLSGDYTIRVFLVRAAARRGAVADFALSVEVS